MSIIKWPVLLILLMLTAGSAPAGDDTDNQPSTFVFPAYGHSYGIRKAGATELFLFMGFRVKFRDPQGLACARLDSWEDPDDPHDDDEVTVYGVNSGQNNIIYNSSMWSLDVYGLDEEDYARLKQPHGICANSRGDVYVADSGNNRIVRLFNPGSKLQFVSAIGLEGTGPGEFRFPRQVALDSQGNLYVTDTENHRIQVFDDQEKFRYIIGGSDELQYPNAIAVTDQAEKYRYHAGNFIVLVDSVNQRISQYDLKGNLVKRCRITSTGYKNGSLEYIAVDYYNQILITDSQNHCIHKFEPELNYITSFGEQGDEDHQFEEPRGIAIYRRFGQLFIAERTGAQYYWIGTDFTDFHVQAGRNSTLFRIRITEPSFIYADIFDLQGNFVKRIADKQYLYPAGLHTIFWDNRLALKVPETSPDEPLTLSSISRPGKKVSSAIFRIQISAEATYSSRTYFRKTVNREFRLGESNP